MLCNIYRHGNVAAEVPANLQTLVDAVLYACLPAMCRGIAAAFSSPAGAASDQQGSSQARSQAVMLIRAADMLSLPCLAAALAARVRQPGGSMLVQLGTQLVAALPTAPFPGRDGVATAIDSHAAAAMILRALARHLHEPEQASGTASSKAAESGSSEAGRELGSRWTASGVLQLGTWSAWCSAWPPCLTFSTHAAWIQTKRPSHATSMAWH